jgi:hypothetical protein
MIKKKACSHGNEVKSYRELDRVTGEFVLQQVVLKSDHLQVQTRLAKAEFPLSNRARLNWPMLRQRMKKQNSFAAQTHSMAPIMPDDRESEADGGKRFPSDLSKSTAIKKTTTEGSFHEIQNL